MIKKLKQPNYYQRFYTENEKELVLLSFGFDDFLSVKPVKYPYVRANDIIHYVLRGKGKLFVEGKEYQVSEKQFFFVPRGKSVSYYPNEKDKWAYVWIDYDGYLSNFYSNKLGVSVDNPVVSAPTDFDETVFFDILDDLDTLGKVGYYKVKSAFFACVDKLSSGEKITTPIRALVKKAMEIIDINYSDSSFNVESVANTLHVSQSYLSRIFKKENDQTVSNYLISVRQKKAGELLLKTSLTAKEIGFRVGYSEDVHFLKEFKKFYGVTTKEYRIKNT